MNIEHLSTEEKAILDARSAEFEKDQSLGTEWHLIKKQFMEDQ